MIIQHSPKQLSETSLAKNLEHIIKRIKKGDLKTTMEDSLQLYKKHPKSANLVNIIGAINFQLRKKNNAIKYYEKALSINPNFIEALYNLGVALNSMHRAQEALKFLNRANKANPNSFLILHAIGLSYKKLKNSTIAVQFFQKSLEIKSNHVPTLNELGIIYSHLGKNQKALKYFRKILEIDPLSAKTHRHISLITDYTIEKTHILELKALLEKKLSTRDEAQIRYAYFRALSAKGEVSDAYNNLNRSNALRKNHVQYNIQNELQIFKKIKSFHLKDEKNKKATYADQSKLKNIFIIGMPRSGTTLVEQILGSHSQVFKGGEVPYLGNQLYPKFSNFDNKLSYANLNYLYQDYQSLINNLSPQAEYFVDKMPTNFLWIGIISRLFPNTLFVNIRRNPMAVVWSNYKHYFASKELNFSNNFDDIIAYFRAYEDLMNFWKNNLNQEIYELNYEQLTTNPKNEIKNLLKFCGLDWENSCLSFYKKDGLVQTASRSQVRKPIYKGSSNEWKKYAKHLAAIEKKVKSSLGASN